MRFGEERDEEMMVRLMRGVEGNSCLLFPGYRGVNLNHRKLDLKPHLRVHQICSLCIPIDFDDLWVIMVQKQVVLWLCHSGAELAIAHFYHPSSRYAWLPLWYYREHRQAQ